MGQKVCRVAVRFLGMALLGACSCLLAQGTGAATSPDAVAAQSEAELPDAPTAQIELASAAEPQAGQAENAQQQPGTGAAPAAGGAAQTSSGSQSSSSSQSSAQQPTTQESQHQKAEEEVKEQEHQRMAGIVPTFNLTYRSDAVALSPGEKFRLEFRAAIDPYTFSIAMIVAGLGEAKDSNPGFGWGPGGFAKRASAAYADNVIGNTLGNAVLPSILHQDPRYYRLGHGSIQHRVFYAAATTFICKHDNTGKWEPNYSNVGGNILAGAISNLYYPAASRSGIGLTFSNGFIVTAEGAFGSTLEEFWPDISRKFFHKDPTHGLDAQARAADAAAKQKKQQQETQKHQ
jgi:hypothetical protein